MDRQNDFARLVIDVRNDVDDESSEEASAARPAAFHGCKSKQLSATLCQALIGKIGKTAGSAGHQPRGAAIFMHAAAGIETSSMMSVSVPSEPARTITLRPWSWGRPSSQ
jgi:hypothetical protein